MLDSRDRGGQGLTMGRERNVRLSQTLAPFGVGAIYDILGESLVACETGWWKGQGTRIRLKRLEQQLGVSGFRSAPSHASLFGGTSAKVPYYRFPQWLFCPRCRQMVQWRERMEVEGEPPRCQNDRCGGQAQLVPMRFLTVCEDGHMDDVPWQFWAHIGATSENQKQCRSRNLSFLSRRDAGTGLGSLQVKCNTCGAGRSLNGISSKDSLAPYRLRCSGRQPWQRFEAAEQCDKTPQVLQRGASNVYFSLVSSAIDIPPESNYSSFNDVAVDITNSDEFAVIRSNPSGPIASMLAEDLADRYGVPVAEVMGLVQEQIDELAGVRRPAQAETSDLATEEWLAFQTNQDEVDDRNKFITREVPFLSPDVDPPAPFAALADLVGRVVVASRLREVRALVSFSRLRPDARQLDPGLGRDLDWLPAIEVYGEGVFLSFAEQAIARWEQTDAVRTVAEELESRRRSSLFGPRLGAVATPRFVLLHTLAHLLIRQLSFDCGYAASSLRERIYAKSPAEGDPQAGILIYTAAGDVEGTLGGLVRQGEAPRLAQTLLRALEGAAWCSSDPLCRESTGQGFGAMNLGACHACTLVSETSCAYFNVLLDRGMVVGAEGLPGFFTDVLESALHESSRQLGGGE
jgi:hypothetical protein